jgi:hypothetical protein
MSRKMRKVVCRASLARFYLGEFRGKEFFNSHAIVNSIEARSSFGGS